MIKISVADRNTLVKLNKLRKNLVNLKPVMTEVAGEMLDAVEENFKTEGAAIGKPWKPLSPARIKQRMKQGTWPGKILQVSQGGLANSITSSATNTEAVISTNKAYAAIHHFGGTIQRSRVIHFKSYKRGKFKGKTLFSKAGKATFGQKVAVTVNIPERPFMEISDSIFVKIKTIIGSFLR